MPRHDTALCGADLSTVHRGKPRVWRLLCLELRKSGYDIAVFLKDLTDRWREFHRLADLRTDILADTGVFIEARPFRAGAYRERSPMMHEIRREGVDF